MAVELSYFLKVEILLQSRLPLLSKYVSVQNPIQRFVVAKVMKKLKENLNGFVILKSWQFNHTQISKLSYTL